jgi:CheY-like chemotaxis protein
MTRRGDLKGGCQRIASTENVAPGARAQCVIVDRGDQAALVLRCGGRKRRSSFFHRTRDTTGVDGLELTRRLKASPATRNTIILALTAYAMVGDEAKARAAGCDGYVAKPIDTRTLPATIADYLRRGPSGVRRGA